MLKKQNYHHLRIKHPRTIILFLISENCSVMARNTHLPLYDDFLDLFINHEVNNWQAKDFWEKMLTSRPNMPKTAKRRMYSGLKILLNFKYLEADPTTSSKNSFRYKETPRLNDLRNKYKKQKLQDIFMSKKSDLLTELEEKENNIEFLNNLLSNDATLEKYFITHKHEIEKKINSNIKLMEDILS